MPEITPIFVLIQLLIAVEQSNKQSSVYKLHIYGQAFTRILAIRILWALDSQVFPVFIGSPAAGLLMFYQLTPTIKRCANVIVNLHTYNNSNNMSFVCIIILDKQPSYNEQSSLALSLLRLIAIHEDNDNDDGGGTDHNDNIIIQQYTSKHLSCHMVSSGRLRADTSCCWLQRASQCFYSISAELTEVSPIASLAQSPIALCLSFMFCHLYFY